MRFPNLKQLCFSKVSNQHSVVTNAADELLQLWGAGAYEQATYLSWREDFGLVSSPRPGHWAKVRRQVSTRLGHREDELLPEFASMLLGDGYHVITA